MSRAIVLVDHGSRRAEANAVIEDIAALIRSREPGRIVRVAHMELARPTLEEALDSCAAAGVEEIVVHPYFLGPGTHTREDIPRLVESAARRHPELRVRVSAPLNAHDKIADVVLERVSEAERGD